MSNWQFTEQHYNLLLDKITKVEEHMETANGRTRKLENWRNYLLGAWAVLSFFAIVMYDKLKSMVEALSHP